ncbi:hypothetical protein LNP74_07165 [Klebsiella pneumoniae subsp. pneumoniae]|nr:hypothetical protein [Klebsiella pneumoniae subsp. pneumoniae]
MTIAYRDRVPPGHPARTRGIIDIAAVRTVAAVGASAHRLPVMATVKHHAQHWPENATREYIQTMKRLPIDTSPY